MEQGRMTEAGLGLVKLAKESGAWTALQEVQESVIPPDLSEALAAGDKAEENFKAFRPSSKRIILEWILNAKDRRHGGGGSRRRCASPSRTSGRTTLGSRGGACAQPYPRCAFRAASTFSAVMGRSLIRTPTASATALATAAAVGQLVVSPMDLPW